MTFKPVVFGLLAVACLSAAAGGAYVAVRQSATEQPMAVSTPGPNGQEAAAPRPVAETEAVVEQPVAKKLIAKIKEAKLKVEAQINGEKVRITGKKRDDLQSAMALLRGADFEVPLQFENFRD